MRNRTPLMPRSAAATARTWGAEPSVISLLPRPITSTKSTPTRALRRCRLNLIPRLRSLPESRARAAGWTTWGPGAVERSAPNRVDIPGLAGCSGTLPDRRALGAVENAVLGELALILPRPAEGLRNFTGVGVECRARAYWRHQFCRSLPCRALARLRARFGAAQQRGCKP